MKVGVYGGEAFPVYEIYKDGFTEIEVPEETLASWQETFDAFQRMQNEIVAIMEKQGFGDRVWSSNGTFNGFHLEAPFTHKPIEEKEDHRWFNSDPRLSINKRANIVILRPPHGIHQPVGTGHVDSKETFCIFTSFDDHSCIHADQDWDQDWYWTFGLRRGR